MDKKIVIVLGGLWVVDQEGNILRKLGKKERINCLERGDALKLFVEKKIPKAWQVFGEISFGGLGDAFMNWSSWDCAYYESAANNWLPSSQRKLFSGHSPAVVICRDESVGQVEPQPIEEQANAAVAA